MSPVWVLQLRLPDPAPGRPRVRVVPRPREDVPSEEVRPPWTLGVADRQRSRDLTRVRREGLQLHGLRLLPEGVPRRDPVQRPLGAGQGVVRQERCGPAREAQGPEDQGHREAQPVRRASREAGRLDPEDREALQEPGCPVLHGMHRELQAAEDRRGCDPRAGRGGHRVRHPGEGRVVLRLAAHTHRPDGRRDGREGRAGQTQPQRDREARREDRRDRVRRLLHDAQAQLPEVRGQAGLRALPHDGVSWTS